jgi:hypothetical protein
MRDDGTLECARFDLAQTNPNVLIKLPEWRKGTSVQGKTGTVLPRNGS